MVYCPERTIQQYCMTCSKWFDRDCIAQRAVDRPLSELKTSSITVTKILRMPIEHGTLEFEAEGGYRKWGNGHQSAGLVQVRRIIEQLESTVGGL